jgi:hypothetical protein
MGFFGFTGQYGCPGKESLPYTAIDPGTERTAEGSTLMHKAVARFGSACISPRRADVVQRGSSQQQKSHSDALDRVQSLAEEQTYLPEAQDP